MKIIRVGVLGLMIVSATALQGAATRSVVDFSQQTQHLDLAVKKQSKNFAIVDRLDQWVTGLKNARPTADTIWEEKELTEPVKHFLISTVARLGLDIAKGAVRGNFSQGSIDPNHALVLLGKSFLQGGLVGGCIGAAGSWGTLPQVSTASLLEHDIFAQLLLELFSGFGEEFVRNGSIDESICFYATAVLLPLLVVAFQSLVICSGRNDMMNEKMLVEAALRGLRVHENTCLGK